MKRGNIFGIIILFFLTTLCMWITYSMVKFIYSDIVKFDKISQEHQQILQAISGSQLSMEYLVTEALEFNCKQ